MAWVLPLRTSAMVLGLAANSFSHSAESSDSSTAAMPTAFMAVAASMHLSAIT